MQVSQSSHTSDIWASSVPDIQVFQRTDESSVSQSSEVSQSSDDSIFFDNEWDDSYALDSYESHRSQEPEITSESYESFLDDVYARPPSLLGTLAFWTISAACIIAILSMALFHIWAHGQATRLGFIYSQSSKQTARLKEERRVLNLQLAKLRSPNRLSRIARQQLGMQLPERSHVISKEQVLEKLQLYLPTSQRKKTRLRFASHSQKP